MTYIDFINQCKSDNQNLHLEGIHTHHIIPRSEGGTDITDNLVQLTPAQHFWAHILYDKENDSFTSRMFKNYSHLNPQTYEDCLPYNEMEMKRREKAYSDETRKKIGNGNRGKVRSEEEKKQISEKLLGNKNHMYGKHHTDEAKRKMSINRTGKCIGEDNHFYGKHHTEESKKKISESHKGKSHTGVKNHPNTSKSVLQFSKEGQFIAEYPSLSEASRCIGVSSQLIGLCCRGIKKSARGFLWRYS